MTERHSALRDILARAAVEVGYCGPYAEGMGGLGVVREVPSGIAGVPKQDVEMIYYREHGAGPTRVAGVDVTVAHALGRSYIRDSQGLIPGEAAGIAAQRKRAAHVGYTEGRSDHVFIPAAFEAMGRFGKDVLKLVGDISRADWVREQWGKERPVP